MHPLILSTLLGAGLGYGWFRLVGCASGACPLTARWWTATLYGAVMGAFFAAGR